MRCICKITPNHIKQMSISNDCPHHMIAMVAQCIIIYTAKNFFKKITNLLLSIVARNSINVNIQVVLATCMMLL